MQHKEMEVLLGNKTIHFFIYSCREILALIQPTTFYIQAKAAVQLFQRVSESYYDVFFLPVSNRCDFDLIYISILNSAPFSTFRALNFPCMLFSIISLDM